MQVSASGKIILSALVSYCNNAVIRIQIIFVTKFYVSNNSSYPLGSHFLDRTITASYDD